MKWLGPWFIALGVVMMCAAWSAHDDSINAARRARQVRAAYSAGWHAARRCDQQYGLASTSRGEPAITVYVYDRDCDPRARR